MRIGPAQGASVRHSHTGDGVKVGGVGAAPSEFLMHLRCRQTPVGWYAPARSTRWWASTSLVSRSAALLWAEAEVDLPRRPHRSQASTHVPTGPEHSSRTLFNRLQSRVLGGHGGGSLGPIRADPASVHVPTYACKSQLHTGK